MKKRAAVGGRKQDRTAVAMSVAMQQLILPLLLAMDATKKGLLSFVQQMGMVCLSELLAKEAAMIVGPKGQHIEGLRDVFRILAHWPKDRHLELAPKYWAATRARLDPRELALEFGPLTVPPPTGPPAEEQTTTNGSR